MSNDALETALEALKDRLKPYEIFPLESVLMPTDRTRAEYGLALVVGLVPAACTPGVLAQIVGVMIETLREAIVANSLVGFQVTFRSEVDGRDVRFYRIGVPVEQFDDILALDVLPAESGEILPGVHGQWFQKCADP